MRIALTFSSGGGTVDAMGFMLITFDPSNPENVSSPTP